MTIDLSPAERRLVDTGHAATNVKKKTFRHWAAIGHALKIVSNKTGGNRLRFKTMREQTGFGEITPADVCRLLQVMANIDAVDRWRATLTPDQQSAWCSPSAIVRHCPIFKKAPTEAKLSPYAKLEQEHAATLERLHQLERQVSAAAGSGDLDQARRAYVALLPADPEARRAELVALVDAVTTIDDIKGLEGLRNHLNRLVDAALTKESRRKGARVREARRQAAKQADDEAAEAAANKAALNKIIGDALAQPEPKQQTERVDDLPMTLTWERQDKVRWIADAGPGFYSIHRIDGRWCGLHFASADGDDRRELRKYVRLIDAKSHAEEDWMHQRQLWSRLGAARRTASTPSRPKDGVEHIADAKVEVLAPDTATPVEQPKKKRKADA